MHPTKVAAILALGVALVAVSYLCFVLYQNVVLLKGSIDAFDGIDDHSSFQYAVSGGIVIVALIASLALFGATKDNS